MMRGCSVSCRTCTFVAKTSATRPPIPTAGAKSFYPSPPTTLAGRASTAWPSFKPMPAGTRIDCPAHFDNSDANPANPDPTVEVRWGEQTFDEMMIGFIDFDEEASVSLNPGTAQARTQTSR